MKTIQPSRPTQRLRSTKATPRTRPTQAHAARSLAERATLEAFVQVMPLFADVTVTNLTSSGFQQNLVVPDTNPGKAPLLPNARALADFSYNSTLMSGLDIDFSAVGQLGVDDLLSYPTCLHYAEPQLQMVNVSNLLQLTFGIADPVRAALGPAPDMLNQTACNWWTPSAVTLFSQNFNEPLGAATVANTTQPVAYTIACGGVQVNLPFYLMALPGDPASTPIEGRPVVETIYGGLSALVARPVNYEDITCLSGEKTILDRHELWFDAASPPILGYANVETLGIQGSFPARPAVIAASSASSTPTPAAGQSDHLRMLMSTGSSVHNAADAVQATGLALAAALVVVGLLPSAVGRLIGWRRPTVAAQHSAT